MSVNHGDGGPQDGQVGEVSPIAYDEKNMPRTVNATRFVMTGMKANELKKQIVKLCENIHFY